MRYVRTLQNGCAHILIYSIAAAMSIPAVAIGRRARYLDESVPVTVVLMDAKKCEKRISPAIRKMVVCKVTKSMDNLQITIEKIYHPDIIGYMTGNLRFVSLTLCTL